MTYVTWNNFGLTHLHLKYCNTFVDTRVKHCFPSRSPPTLICSGLFWRLDTPSKKYISISFISPTRALEQNRMCEHHCEASLVQKHRSQHNIRNRQCVSNFGVMHFFTWIYQSFSRLARPLLPKYKSISFAETLLAQAMSLRNQLGPSHFWAASCARTLGKNKNWKVWALLATSPDNLPACKHYTTKTRR